MLMSTEPLLLFNSSMHGCQMSVSGPANRSEALWDSLVVSQGVLRQMHSSRTPAIIYNGEKKRMIRLLLNYENCRFDTRWLYRCRAKQSLPPPAKHWIFVLVKCLGGSRVAEYCDIRFECTATSIKDISRVFLKTIKSIFVRHFVTLILRLGSQRYGWRCSVISSSSWGTSCSVGYSVLSVMCWVLRLLFGVGWQGKRSLSASFFCATWNLWLTSTSSALLLTALLHCFKHIKQCCWSFSLLVTNRHYLFPCIYVLFCFSLSVSFHDIVLFKRPAFLHAFVF